MKNNLFYYATSELSQDAFICWLCSFALENVNSDPVLKECANGLISLFVPELNADQFVLKNVERQVDHVDVLLSLETSNNAYKIIVEDKTHTSEHDNQLENYKDIIQSKFPNCIVRGVYYKTGFQSDLSSVKKAGYHIVTRKQIVDFMRPYASDPNVKNQIFLDYFEYWDAFQIETEQYNTLPVSAWGWKQINGFYDSLKNTNYLANMGLWMGYGYVANKSGGFDGLWTGPDNYKVQIDGTWWELYLQLEIISGGNTSAQLCLKLCAEDKTIDTSAIRNVRDIIVYDDQWKYKLSKYNFKKPNRLAIGKYMTIGVYEAELSSAEQIQTALKNATADYYTLIRDLT